MKRKYSSFVLVVLLVAIGLSTAGCGIHGQGETPAEGHLRHKRVLENYTQQLADDIDMVLMLDKPSKLNSLRVR